MPDRELADAVRGHTIRFTWMGGPTEGKTHEHVFHADGTVEWRDAGEPEKPRVENRPGQPAKERPAYAAIRVAPDIYLVSYLASSGYTLTVVLNFQDRSIVGFASGAKEWYPLRGRLEVVG
jgi:hypothetical protein